MWGEFPGSVMQIVTAWRRYSLICTDKHGLLFREDGVDHNLIVLDKPGGTEKADVTGTRLVGTDLLSLHAYVNPVAMLLKQGIFFGFVQVVQ